MLSAMRVLLLRLRKALGAEPRSSAPSANASRVERRSTGAYRTSAERDGEPDEPPSGGLLEQIIAGRHTPFLPWPRGEATLTRLDPPGLFQGLSIFAAQRWFWQYQCCSVILVELGNDGYVYTPSPVPTSEGERVTRLPITPTYRRSATGEMAPTHTFGGERDLAPRLAAELRWLAEAGGGLRVREAIGLLHVLATFTGQQSREIALPRVVVGDTAVALYDERLGASAREEVHRALREPGGERVTVLIDRVVESDGFSGGYWATLALAKLNLGGEGLSHEWEIVWADSEEGLALS